MPVRGKLISRVLLLLSAVIFCLTPVSSYYQPSHQLRLQDYKLRAPTAENGLDASIQPLYKIKPFSSELFILSDVRLDITRALFGEYSTDTVFRPHEITYIAHYFRAPPALLS